MAANVLEITFTNLWSAAVLCLAQRVTILCSLPKGWWMELRRSSIRRRPSPLRSMPWKLPIGLLRKMRKISFGQLGLRMWKRNPMMMASCSLRPRWGWVQPWSRRFAGCTKIRGTVRIWGWQGHLLCQVHPRKQSMLQRITIAVCAKNRRGRRVDVQHRFPLQRMLGIRPTSNWWRSMIVLVRSSMRCTWLTTARGSRWLRCFVGSRRLMLSASSGRDGFLSSAALEFWWLIKEENSSVGISKNSAQLTPYIILLWHCGVGAPWQNGICERAGGTIKVLLASIVTAHQVQGHDELDEALAEAVSAYNGDINEMGVSPSQAAVGRQPKVHGDVLNGVGNLAEHSLIDDKPDVSRQLAIRETAKVAMTRLHFSKGIRRAELARSRSSTVEQMPEPGAIVYFYGVQKYNSRTAPSRRRLTLKRWHGPALVVAVEGPNLYLSFKGQLTKCAAEHIAGWLRWWSR